VQPITSLQRRGHTLENNINTYYREEIVEGLDRSNRLTFQEYFCEYKTNIPFLVDVPEDEASDPFRTPATKYQFTVHHIPQVQRLPWAGIRYFKAEINFDRMFHIFHPTSTNIGGGDLPVIPLRNCELREYRFSECHIVPLDIFVTVFVVFAFNAREK
jgi:hypothetical protein